MKRLEGAYLSAAQGMCAFNLEVDGEWKQVTHYWEARLKHDTSYQKHDTVRIYDLRVRTPESLSTEIFDETS